MKIDYISLKAEAAKEYAAQSAWKRWGRDTTIAAVFIAIIASTFLVYA